MASSAMRSFSEKISGLRHRGDHSEGRIARSIEHQTAKLPSDLFLWLALGSIAGALALQIRGEEQKSIFVGEWAPTFLLLGIYNKIVKVQGSDQQHKAA